MLLSRVALFRACFLLFAFCASSSSNAAAFTTGNLAVYRVGTGTGSLVSSGNAVFIDEYTPGGSLVQSIALPTTANGANFPLIESGTATSDGFLTRSVDGNCLWLTGYGTTVGGATLTGTTSASVPRVVGRINAAGAIDTTTALNNYSSATNIRSAVGNDCNSAFVTGATGTTGAGLVSGVVNVAIGATTAGTALSTTLTNLRQVNIFNGQLYVSTSSGSAVRVGTVGTGTPTTAGQTITNLPGIPTTTSPYAFFFAKLSAASAGADTLYIAHDDANALAKYSLNAGTWVSKGTVGVAADLYRGLTGVVSGSTVTLYAVRKGGSGATGGGELVSLVDSSGYDGAFTATPTLLATATANTAFRGVALTPASAALPTVALSLSTNSASEAAQTVVTITATASSPVATAQTVTVAVSGTGTGITAGDYTLSGTTITIPAGGTTGTVTFTVVDDTEVEGLETATIMLTSPSAGIALGSPISANVSITDNDVGNTAPSISAIPPLAVVLTLADNPTTSFTVSDAESAPGSLTLTVLSSSNPGVVPVANVTLSNVSGAVTAAVTPLAVGYADLTIQVSDGALTATQVLRVAASAAPVSPSQTRYLFGTCDASTAVAVDAATMFVADDENQALRLYSRTASGYPIASFDYTTSLGLTDISGGIPREVDLEASTRIGNRIYWLGSHSNSATAGSARPNRNRLFATDLSGVGASATLSFVGYYAGLRSDLLAWDGGNGHGLGADYFGFTASAASGVIPETADGSGFNIEGLTVAPDGTTGWIAFRAPISPASARTKALIVPVTNFTALVGASPAAGPAAFGAPILLDLGGRGIRSIDRATSGGGYVIIAGPAASATGTAPNDFRLYRWSGVTTDAPRITSASLTGLASTGSPEGIVEVPANAGSTTAIQMVADSGDTNWYADGTACKDLTEGRFKAFRADSIALGTSTYRIHDVQGTGNASPLAGQTVSIQGIVTGSYQASTELGGFFVQEEDANADADPLTSEGIFVFHGATPVAVGDKVNVTGTVVEFGTAPATLTEISSATVSVVSSGNPLPAPVTVTLPVAVLGDLERYESMRVQTTQTLTVSQNFSLARYGELTLSANGRLPQPSNFIDPNDSPASGTNSSGTSNVAAITAQANLNLRSSILLADTSSTQNPAVIPFIDPVDKTLRVGTTVAPLTGILSHSFGNYAIHATTPPSFTYAPRPLTPPAVGGALKVAAFNVLNFFNGDGAGGGFPTSRGADTLAEFNRQKAKTVAALCGLGADVVGLMEMENDATTAAPALNELTAALNATSGCGAWSFVANPANWGSFPGSTDEIRPALIYRNTAVAPVGSAMSPNDSAFTQARAPVAQTFRVISGASTGAKLSVIVNHFKSKGSGGTGADADQGDGQGFYNASRKAQAVALLSFITTVQNAANDLDVLVIGDLNAYTEEDPMDILRAGGLVNLGSDDYSYVFDSQTGSLDHALATPSLIAQITNSGVWHINADEPIILDYNVEFKNTAGCTAASCTSPDYYAPTPFRSSDHDPVLVGMALVAPRLTLTPSPQSFGTIVLGAGPVDRTLTLANSTAQSGNLTAINVTGTGYARNGGTCPTTFPASIAGNSSCTVIVRFTATVVGTPTGSVDVTGDAAFSTALNVTVVNALTATPTSVNSTVLSPVSLTLSVTGGTPPYIWSSSTGTLPAGLTLSGNTVSGTPTAAGNSSVTFNVIDGSGQTASLVVNFSITAPPTLDIDDSAPTTPYDAATDGMLLMRYLLGLRDAALTTNVISSSARRDATAIAAHIAANLSRLDVDGDGKTLATTDGVMILRRLLGITSPAAITQGVKNSSRSDSDVVSAIDALKP